MLKVNSTLTELNVSDNEIGAEKDLFGDVTKATPEGPVALADGLAANSSVTQVDASGNHLRAAGAASLGDMLKVNTTLTELNLSNNEVGGSVSYTHLRGPRDS